MLRFDNIVFGPIKSRRLGVSLGINLLPGDGKICNFDCIYCECGWNKDGLTHASFPAAETVLQQLEARLAEMAENGSKPDSITFSGHGEPTLHPDFARVVDGTIALRNKYCPKAMVSVLSNATTLAKEDVRASLMKVDNPILKLDAPYDAAAKEVNRPQCSYSVRAVVDAMKAFDGNFVLQTMMLGGSLFDFRKDADALQAWKDIVRELGPRQVMIYSLDRPSPQEGLEKLDPDTMKGLVKDLITEGYNVKIY